MPHLEQIAREEIDRQLEATGWVVQDLARINLTAGLGVAIREFPLHTGHADYLLYVDGKAAGVIEAKPEGHPLIGVELQSLKYVNGLPGRAEPWTERLWVYDLRTNQHFTQKENPLRREHLDEFVECYEPGKRQERTETWSEENREGRWRSYSYEELTKRDKLNLDIFWLRDKSLEDSEDLLEPEVLAREIIEDLPAALEQFSAVAAKLEEGE